MATATCPLCKKNSNTVTRTTVYSQVKKHFKPHIKSEEYWFCNNEACDIVYFSLDNDEIYFVRDFDEPLK